MEKTQGNRISYFNVPGRVPLIGCTIGDLIDESAAKYGHKEAIVVPFQNIRKTFSALKTEVDELAKGLLSLGLECGDRLAVWSPNTYECYISQLAGWKAGLIVVCINAALQRRELSYALNKVGVRCIIISKAFRNQHFYSILCSVIPELPLSQPGYLKSSGAAELEFVVSVEPNLPGTIPFQSLVERGQDYILGYQQDFPRVDFDDGCTIFFTSGTTGSPKAALASHHQLINNGNIVGRRVLLSDRDRICLPIPLFHGYGCQVGIFAALLHGATIVLPSYGYDSTAILKTSAEEKCTFIAGTSTMFSDILKQDINSLGVNLSNLRSAIAGGLVCSAQLIKEMKSKLNFQHIFINYGMTETGSSYLGLPEDPDDIISSTVGYPCDNIEVKCVDETGRIVPIGTEGELCVRGYPVMKGYWGEPTSTAEVLEQSKWFHTGDIFIMSSSGHGRFVGRIKEMVNRGGENLHPKEVEDFLLSHPKVKTAYVFGIPDVRMGEVPAAWIELKDGANMTPDEIKSFCRGQIAHFKIPKYILFRNDFPKTPLGKPQKFRMREETIKLLKL